MSIDIGTLTILLAMSMVLVFATGLPVAFSLGGLAMIFGVLFMGPQSFGLVAQASIRSLNMWLLMAIPLFILLGQVLQQSGVADAMFRMIYVWSGRVRGGLAMGGIVICTFIAAMVGIIGAGIISVGVIAMPAMLKRNYNKHLAMGTIMAGGALGMLIPPSVNMILYSSVTRVSIGRMFAGGIIPGLILAGFYITYIGIRCWLNPALGPALPPEERGSWRERFISLKDAILAFGLIFMVLGSIFLGMATPTEAAAVGVLGAIVLTGIYRKLSLGVVKRASLETMKFAGLIMWMLIGATVFSDFYMFMGGGHLLQEIVEAMHMGPWMVLIMMQLSLLILGMLMDDTIIVLITAPLYVPLIISLGFDPVWFGILMIVNLQVAVLTPPYGFALFYFKAIAPPGVTMVDLYRSIVPFVGLQILGLILFMLFPLLLTWLPGLIFGG